MKQDGADITATLTSQDRLRQFIPTINFAQRWRACINGLLIGTTALVTGLSPGFVRSLEHQGQALMWELRGEIAAPDDIIILAIDEESLSQGQHFLDQPEAYPELAAIGSWPWPRATYASAIDKILNAGAKSIALDIVFALPSSYGPEDDKAFAEVLADKGSQVVLAAEYGDIDLRQGSLLQPTLPLPDFREMPVQVGAINFILEPNGKIHRLSREFLKTLQVVEAELLGEDLVLESSSDPSVLSFAEATLKASQVDYTNSSGDHIFFHGPAKTFQHIPFWYLLDDELWKSQLDNGRFFEDKIVLVGSTASLHQDFHAAPFSKSWLHSTPMAGVEILANTVATLRDDLALYSLVQSPLPSALIVAGWLGGMAIVIGRISSRTPFRRLVGATASGLAWGLVSFVVFTTGGIFVPIAMPILSVLGFAMADFAIGFFSEQLQKKTLRSTLARYVTSPIVQEIISQQDDFKDLLAAHESEIIGTLLSERYRISKILGSGGFGDTYLAKDMQRPGNPICVVKQLKIVSDNPRAHQLAQRLFASEATTLERLGEHDQIPRLLAYFESNYSFYLVQEMIEGTLLKDKLNPQRPMSQRSAAQFLLDLLPVIQTVHAQGVIHRDIKPSNIISRNNDQRYVLIDFGAVKQISNRLTDTNARITSTVGIGTQGYMPSEQSAGLPNFSSDLYALGVTTIEALTGLPPHALQRDSHGEIIWTDKVPGLDPGLANVIDKMVRYDFNQRYATAQAVLKDIRKLKLEFLSEAAPEKEIPAQSLPEDDEEAKLSTVILPTDWNQNYKLPNATTVLDKQDELDVG
ncbi:CHASE2 domain-containing protein [Leptolyngbyaceae cyanobacterium CCMR0082]|uniref:non-specific serine/threonine protein kinase n=2 Tax=Adonisia turfae TaxID=2950184 RepID=A0A6M0S4G3_9CYAN|nr:serine/threonine-protein kinase [Adonisia turfae]MDV3350486.1 serine/threonine-protein kinase [Leptothoe sp. LEGE 181152]NEZ55681.1 CHASE2 domain-containing protein [Adonisia turfae CCMR0081]NEZ63338.1 CHASE2 domain-containing protein [Adonisia turfae CCMR0082]